MSDISCDPPPWLQEIISGIGEKTFQTEAVILMRLIPTARLPRSSRGWERTLQLAFFSKRFRNGSILFRVIPPGREWTPGGLVLVMNFSVCTFPHVNRKRRAGALLSTLHDKTLAGFFKDFNNVSKDELNSSSLLY